MTTSSLQESFDPLRLIDALATAVIVVDADLRVVTVNSAAQALLGQSASKLVGCFVAEVFVAQPEFIGLIGRALLDGRSFTERELELTPTELHSVIVDCTVSPWHPDKDSVASVVVELNSVERHQRIQSEENMMFHNQVTTALMRGLAHEVKNPLGGIRGAAQLLERELKHQHQAEYTQIIIGEADRLRTLVDKMLGPNSILEKRTVNIHEVLEHVRQLVEVEQTGALVIQRDYDPSLPDFIGDRDQLVQAFLNLVSNAAHAVEETDGMITLRSRAQRKFTIGDKVHRLVIRVDIVDTGPGVPDDIADSIFFPMVSGHASGSGLGLPMAQSMINRQGGLIGFKSAAGCTEFSVWLPIEVGK